MRRKGPMNWCSSTLQQLLNVLYFAEDQLLYNPRLKRRYDVRDDIPVMLIDEATTVEDAEHERLLAKAEAEGIKPTFEPA